MIRAKTIMAENVITINENAAIAAAAKLMVNKHVKSLLVMKNGVPIAVATENGLIKGILSPGSKTIRVKDIMSKKFIVIGPDTSYSDIVKKLRQEKIKM